MNLKEEIRTISEQKGLTLKEVATLADMSYNGLHDKFRRNSLTVRDLVKLLDVLGKEIKIVDK